MEYYKSTQYSSGFLSPRDNQADINMLHGIEYAKIVFKHLMSGEFAFGRNVRVEMEMKAPLHVLLSRILTTKLICSHILRVEKVGYGY
jgi:hypothetical protein